MSHGVPLVVLLLLVAHVSDIDPWSLQVFAACPTAFKCSSPFLSNPSASFLDLCSGLGLPVEGRGREL